jgi:hypothetical protein
VVKSVHGSTHWVASQTHWEQLPPDGPAKVPVRQLKSVSHQPQSGVVVQASQAGDDAHGSTGVPLQLLWYQRQSAQVAADGPDREPVRQVLDEAHQPQLELAVQSSHVVSLLHGSAAVTQAPPWQARPAQQSALVTQLWEPVRQLQKPPLQSIQPQQSALLVQAPAASTQHSDEVGLARQLRPAQHSPTAVQLWAASVQLVAGAWQVPLWHSRPVRHGCPVVQQAWPSPPQVGVWHVPPLQVPAHGLPQPPQLRGSVAVLTQELLQHVPLVHAVPVVQHAWPMAPQVPAVVWHVPPVQVRPALQAVPLQHASWAPPQTGAVSQVPPVHTRPEAQALLAQQGWRAPPQVAGGLQTLDWHTSPETHMFPVQHASFSLPHDGGLTQVPLWQTRSVPQALPEQHGWVSLPHGAVPEQVPETQVSPALHAVPLQHGCRSAPQLTTVASLPPPASRCTGAVSFCPRSYCTRRSCCTRASL